MRHLIMMLALLPNLSFADVKSFDPNVSLCTYPITDKGTSFLLFNFKSLSEIKIKFSEDNLEKLKKGPYLFDLEIKNPEFMQKVYDAKIKKISRCKKKDAVIMVDGSLKPKK